jgi:hypothetical protein
LIRGAESPPDHNRAANGTESSHGNQDEKKYLPAIHLISGWNFKNMRAE